jgi:hypothetical protein
VNRISAYLLLGGLVITTNVGAKNIAPQKVPHDFSGNFGHGASNDPNAVVWEIKPSEKGYIVQLDSTKERFIARRLTPVEREAFWRRMLWAKDKTNRIECIGFTASNASTAIICHLDKAAQQATNWVHSDYFYYDQVFGVFDIVRRK